jgi:putative oxidoreductase
MGGDLLQRLFSAFPNAWPGTGILVLRIAVAIALISGGMPELQGVPHSGLFAARLVTVCAGICLLAGLWTPVAGALLAILELWIFFSRGTQASLHLMLFALGLSLVMLGPGAWSVDALLFGRKRIYIPGR